MMMPNAAHAEDCAVPGVRTHEVAAPGGEGSERRRHAPVQALARLSGSHHLDDAAELPPVLGRVPARQDVHRVDVVRADFRRERGRPVVRQRQAIDHELGLILGPAWMQDAVRFKEPAGLRVDQVWQRSSGPRHEALLHPVRADAIDGLCLVRVEQRSLRRHRQFRRQRCEAHGDAKLGRQRRTDVDQSRERCEPIARHRRAVSAEGQPPDDERALRVCVEVLPKLICLAQDLDPAGQGQPRWVGHRETQFASIALAELSQGQQKSERDTRNHFIGEKSVGFTKIESTLTTALPPWFDSSRALRNSGSARKAAQPVFADSRLACSRM